MVSPISARTVRKYMRIFVRLTRLGVVHIGGDHEMLASLRRRDDFDAVLDYLEGAGLVSVFEAADMPPVITLTDDGKTYLERQRDLKSDRRWTRGLAIVAIIISTAALCVSLLSLWLQWQSL